MALALSADQNRAVVKRWSRYSGSEPPNIWGFAPLWRHFAACAFDPKTAEAHRDNPYWQLDIFIARHLSGQPVRSVLSVCCGFGSWERTLVQKLPSIETCVGVDISEGAIAKARELARSHGLDGVIRYEAADLNLFDWQARRGQFDLVIANGALHHLVNLETVLEGIRETLKPGGWLFSSECIGPKHQDHSGRQVELVNALHYLIPRTLRRRAAAPFRHRHRLLRSLWIAYKALRGELNLPNVPAADHPADRWMRKLRTRLGRFASRHSTGHEALNFGLVHDSNRARLLRKDPSEGVRSDEIIDVMRKTFPTVHVHQFGAALLAYALDRQFFEYFDPENSMHVELLEHLCALEEFFIRCGEQRPEYALLFAQAPRQPASQGLGRAPHAAFSGSAAGLTRPLADGNG